MDVSIPLSFTPVDHAALAAVLKEYADQRPGQVVTDFEAKLKEYSGREVVALNSGTAAIHLGLKALGVEPGDYVIAPTFTYVATVNPVLYLGAIPVFIDADPLTWNMDTGLLEETVSKMVKENRKPKAIIIVHTYGMPQDMDAVMKVSSEHGIPVLEDAAEAIGTYHKGKPAGAFGDIGVLSFNNNKILTTYGGGAVFTESKETAEKILFWATQSRDPMPYYFHSEVGHNYRMSMLNAAMGLADWKNLSRKIERRKEVFSHYVELLKPSGWRFPMEEEKGANRWLTVAIGPEGDKLFSRDKCIGFFHQNGVEVRHLWNPLHLHPLFHHLEKYDHGIAQSLFRSGIAFPSGMQDSSSFSTVSEVFQSYRISQGYK